MRRHSVARAGGGRGEAIICRAGAKVVSPSVLFDALRLQRPPPPSAQAAAVLRCWNGLTKFCYLFFFVTLKGPARKIGLDL